MSDDKMMIFGGSGSKALTAAICCELGTTPGQCETLWFPDGNLFVRVREGTQCRD